MLPGLNHVSPSGHEAEAASGHMKSNFFSAVFGAGGLDFGPGAAAEPERCHRTDGDASGALQPQEGLPAQEVATRPSRLKHLETDIRSSD